MKLARIMAIVGAVAAAVLLPLCAPAAPKPATLFYEVRLTSPQGDMGTRKMYIKGAHYAWYVDSPGIKTRLVRNKDGVFLLHPLRNVAAKYAAGSATESPQACLPGPTGDVKQFLTAHSAKKIAEQSLNKKPCLVYTYTEKLTGFACKLWVTKASLSPVRLIMTGAKGKQVITADYVSYELGADVPDSHFRLPKDVQIRPMPASRTAAPAAGN